MVFLGNITVINETKHQVGLIHNFPFHPEHGFGKTEAELLQMGYLMESVPEPTPQEGLVPAGIFIDPTTSRIFYEYQIAEMTQEEKVAELEAQNASMLLALVNGGLL